MSSGLLIGEGIHTRQSRSRETHKKVFQNVTDQVRDKLLLGHCWSIDVGWLTLLDLEQVLLGEASHGTHHRGISQTTPLIEDLKDIANRRFSSCRAFPDQFHDICLQVSKDFANTWPIRPKQGNI